MAPISAVDEAKMLFELTQDLGDDFWNATLTPDTTPVKKPPGRAVSSIPHTPTRKPVSSSTGAKHTTVLSSTIFAAVDHDIASFLEGSADWNFDDDPFTPIKSSKTQVNLTQPAILRYIPDTCTRCVVESVADQYIDNRWRKTIVAKIDASEERVVVYLYDDWYQVDIRIGDIFNVIGVFSEASLPSSSSSPQPMRSISITSQANIVILHPDLLLTATSLSNASQCRRKPLLSSMVRSTTDITPAVVWGNMLHEVMQRCLQEDRWDEQFVEQCIEQAVLASLGELVKIGLSEDIAKREVLDRAKGMRMFADKYLAQEPKANAALANTRAGQHDEPSLLAITKLLDIEEDIWSPTYGIKGKLDATVQGVISDPAPSKNPKVGSHKTYYSSTASERMNSNTPLPLELKTGRAIAGMDHRAQTMLYTLLLSERYGADVQDGLLFYTQSETGEVVRVPRGKNEIRGLMGTRNELASFMWRRVRKSQKEKLDVEMEDATPTQPKFAVKRVKEDKQDMEDEEPFLPPPIDDERSCKRCYAIDTCLLFRKTHPNHSLPAPVTPSSRPLSEKAKAKARATFDPPIPSFLAEVFEAKTGHLTASQVNFFRKWERLLALEERDLVRFKRELWTLGAAERERKGRCFAGMVLMSKEGGDEEWGNDQKIHRFTYTFIRSKNWVVLAPPSSTQSANPALTQNSSQQQAASKATFLNGHLNIGDPITVSVEPNMLALARGYIVDLKPQEVVLGVDHMLDVKALQARLSRNPGHDMVDDDDGELIFRIDKDELFGGMARVRNNLTKLFYADGDSKRLQLVVDLKKPVFSEPTPPFSAAASCSTSDDSNFSSNERPLAPHLSKLNPSQLSAMEKVLSAEDYALILGMPGTGKTTVIAALIRELVGRGKTVLLSSYTHSAVDTILMKLQGLWKDESDFVEDGVQSQGEKKVEFGILRLGNVDKVHPDVRKYTLNARRTATTVEQLEMQIMSPPVVATTCLSIEHPLFSRRHFDYCIVDEASQITLPTCIGPLRFADTFVLVGDHFQLPPLVKNYEARKGGLDVSLFRRLSEAHPDAVVDLRFQYRMNKEIMLLSNRLIYHDRLQCGNEEVANRRLKLGNRHFLKRLHRGHRKEDGHQKCSSRLKDSSGMKDMCWLERLVDEKCKAVFVDTDALPAYDSRVGDLVQNTTEAELVRQLTETLIQCGVQESQIGIISLYRQQVKVLHHLLPERKGVEILTADKSQGRDKDCIIISLVRSNEAGLVGDLVKDWRRMNVSFTRAKKKLVIFGSRKTLESEPLLAQFFELMQEQDWILSLPRGADTVHADVFDVCSTPAKRTSECDHNDVKKEEDDCSRVENSLALRKSGKENAILADTRPMKKLKSAVDVGKGAGAGILKGRPILQDLVGNET